MKRSRLWLTLILIGLALLVSGEINRRQRRNASIAKSRRVIDNQPRRDNQSDSQQTTKDVPIPRDEQPASQQQQNTSSNKQKAARHFRVNATAKRRRFIRRKRAIAFWVQLLAGCATIFIAGLTFAYVHYSSNQWQAMLTGNEQTKIALHVTQRAYVTTEPPQLDISLKVAKMTLNNDGHIPSGPISTTVHEATLNIPTDQTPDIQKHAIEQGWKRYDLSPLASKGQVSIDWRLPAFDESLSTGDSATQTILLSGEITCYDGFWDDGVQSWLFCYQTIYEVARHTIQWAPCNAGTILRQMIRLDGYPTSPQAK